MKKKEEQKRVLKKLERRIIDWQKQIKGIIADFRNEKVILHFDQDGNLRKMERDKIEYYY